MTLVRLWGVTVARGGADEGSSPVLDNLNLVLEPGELVVVGGLRGAGKSTLLAVAAGTLRPQQGEVAIAGRNLVSLQSGSLPYVRRIIGYLPPEPPLVRDETALENVMLALAARGATPAEAEAQAREALIDLDIGALAERQVAALSLPERRLVAIARSLAGHPPVVVLDDPCTGLDERDRTRLLAALRRAAHAGGAVLAATSDATWIAELTAAGARALTLIDGRLEGGAGPTLRVVADLETTPPPVLERPPLIKAPPTLRTIRGSREVS